MKRTLVINQLRRFCRSEFYCHTGVGEKNTKIEQLEKENTSKAARQEELGKKLKLQQAIIEAQQKQMDELKTLVNKISTSTKRSICN